MQAIVSKKEICPYKVISYKYEYSLYGHYFQHFIFQMHFLQTCNIMVHYQPLMENFMTNFCTKNDYLLCEDKFAKQDMVAFKWSLIFRRRLPWLCPNT